MNYHIVLALSAVYLAYVSATFQVQRDADGDDDFICKHESIEMGIVLDSSRSISHEDFETGKKILQDFVGHFQVGFDIDGVRFSFIPYGDGVYVNDSFNLDTYESKEDVVAAIGNITHRESLFTDTGRAISYMANSQLGSREVRPWAEKIGIVVTDGVSQQYELTKNRAEAARDDGIIMFAVGLGLGSGASQLELTNIAGDVSRVTNVDIKDNPSIIAKTLARKICNENLRPTTPPPMTKSNAGFHQGADGYLF